MPYRDPDGILSDFNRTPGQLDEFRIKEAFTGDTSNLDSLEQAADWNQYFDACLRIEAYLKNRIGGPLQTGESGETDKIGSPNLYMSYETLSVPNVSGTVTTVGGTVPSEFGDNPFKDHRFGILHSLYIDQGSTPISGVYANKPNNNSGYLNDLMDLPQYYLSITPTASDGTGRDFTASVLKVDPFGTVFSDNFYRVGSPTWWDAADGDPETLWTYPLGSNYTTTVKYDRPAFACVERTQYVYPPQNGRGGGGKRWSLIISNERGTYETGGLCLVNTFSSCSDMHCDFQFHDVAGDSVENEHPLGSGIVLRFQGTAAGASGYGLYWGAYLPDAGPLSEGWYRVQIVKLNGIDLRHMDWPTGRSAYENPYLRGKILNISGSDYHTLTFGGSGGVPHFYRFQVAGNTISLKRRSGSGPWTTVLTTTDSSISSGQVGFFAEPMDDAAERYLFLTDVTFQNDDPPTTSVDVSIPLIYTLAGKLDGTAMGHE
jgi:hypothetical protein